MIDFLINSNEDITLLVCRECACEIVKKLYEKDFKFIQDKKTVIEELNKDSEIFEITKLVAEATKEDIYFVFASSEEGNLPLYREVITDNCFFEEDEENFEEDINELMVVEALMMENELSLEDTIRLAYRLGKEDAICELLLEDILEDIDE